MHIYQPRVNNMKSKMIIIMLLCLSITCSSYAKNRKAVDTTSVVAVSRVDSLINFASEFVGTPYRSTKYSSRAFDCSGFTLFVFSKFGYKLGASSGDQIFNGTKVGRNELNKGDLVFFKGRNSSSSRIGHVGLIVDVDSVANTFRFIHSSCSQGVIVETFPTSYYSNRYVNACRVIPGVRTISFDDVNIDLPNISDSTNLVVAHINQPQTQPTTQTIEEVSMHIVKKGDTLYSISKRYGTTIDILMSINSLHNHDLQIGNKLKVK